MCWQPIETAPKTGEIVVGDLNGWPVMMAWMDGIARKERRALPRQWWQLPKWEYVEIDRETGWRVLMPTRDFSYGVHGNYGPFKPRQWMPLT